MFLQAHRLEAVAARTAIPNATTITRMNADIIVGQF